MTTTFINVNGVQISTKVIRTTDFINLPHHRIWAEESRVEKRKKSTKGKHLRGAFSPTMASVAIVEEVRTDGTFETYILDGNSRTEFIRNGDLKFFPDVLFATVYRTTSTSVSDELFLAFDSKNAVDTSTDELMYAFRQQGLVLNSSLVNTSALSAIKAAAKKLSGKNLNTYESVQTVSSALGRLDSLRIDRTEQGKKIKDGRRLFANGPLAAVLVFVQENNRAALDTVEAYFGCTEPFSDLIGILTDPSTQLTGAEGTRIGFELTYERLNEVFRQEMGYQA